jgi:hypothetical protein
MQFDFMKPTLSTLTEKKRTPTLTLYMCAFHSSKGHVTFTFDRISSTSTIIVSCHQKTSGLLVAEPGTQ